MGWEIWGRNKFAFLGDAGLLTVSVVLARWPGASADYGRTVVPMAGGCFLLAFVHLLKVFAFVEVNAQKVRLGYPDWLLLKPVSHARLVLVPMLFGGAVVVSVFALWAVMGLRPFNALSGSPLLWISTVLLSFFWWLQALARSLTASQKNIVFYILVAVIHLLVGLMPLMPAGWWSRWQWSLLLLLRLSAVPTARFGLKLMRQGRWEGPSRMALSWRQRRPERVCPPRRPFRSAFAAQFWFEWRCQGLFLPGISGGFALLMFPVFVYLVKKVGAEGGFPPEGVFSLTLVTPLMLSGFMGMTMGKFDMLGAPGELPIYIAVRPMASGGFVLAKLGMALATSGLTWLLTAVATGFWLVLLKPDALFSPAGPASAYGPMGFIAGCVPLFLLLVIWTWKNLLAGIGAGLTGRPWVITTWFVGRTVFFIGLIGLVTTAGFLDSFRKTMLQELTAILIAGLAAKVVFSSVAFAWGRRRNAITSGAIGWLVGGWVLCIGFVAGYAALVSRAINHPEWGLWFTLGGFLVLPLADLAVAPLALAWNRHR
jgi:hypothetical protein